jgi:hypothetical protein
MRSPVDAARVRLFIKRLGGAAKGSGVVYLTGGATAVLHGWRAQTVDIDIKLEPEPPGVFEAIRELKEVLSMNIELASPDDFLPEVPGWRDRSERIAQVGPVDFRHYDYVAQTLSKLERCHDRDRLDVAAMLDRGLVTRQQLLHGLAGIEAELIRFPAVDPAALRARVEALREA